MSKDYKKFHKQIIHLDKKIITEKEFKKFSHEDLRRRQYLSGYSVEDLELILHPMVEDAKKLQDQWVTIPQLLSLSNHYRPISHYFRQNFSQVTNPPIDSLRENKVMSLKTRFGNLGNILDFFENLTNENIYVLDGPILTNSQLKKFKNMFSEKVRVIDCTFDVKDNLKNRLEQIKEESEIAVREGANHLILSDQNILNIEPMFPWI